MSDLDQKKIKIRKQIKNTYFCNLNYMQCPNKLQISRACSGNQASWILEPYLICFSLICFGKLRFYPFIFMDIKLTLARLLTTIKFQGFKMQLRSWERNTIALFSFLKWSVKPLFFAQNLLQKNIVCTFSTLWDTEHDLHISYIADLGVILNIIGMASFL